MNTASVAHTRGWLVASVTTWVEAGAQMSRLTDDLRLLLPETGAD